MTLGASVVAGSTLKFDSPEFHFIDAFGTHVGEAERMPAKRRLLPGCARGFQFDEEDVSLGIHLSLHGVLNGSSRLARETTQTSAQNPGGGR